MTSRMRRLTGLLATVRKMEDLEHAETTARRDEAERARRRARNAHAASSAARSDSGAVAAFLASRQAGQLAADAATHLDLEAETAAEAAAQAEAALTEARIRRNAMERLTETARAEVQRALDAYDAGAIEDITAARAAEEDHDW